jgi:hypothetical protein
MPLKYLKAILSNMGQGRRRTNTKHSSTSPYSPLSTGKLRRRLEVFLTIRGIGEIVWRAGIRAGRVYPRVCGELNWNDNSNISKGSFVRLGRHHRHNHIILWQGQPMSIEHISGTYANKELTSVEATDSHVWSHIDMALKRCPVGSFTSMLKRPVTDRFCLPNVRPRSVNEVFPTIWVSVPNLIQMMNPMLTGRRSWHDGPR